MSAHAMEAPVKTKVRRPRKEAALPAPTLPSVNLMPPEIAEARRLRRAQTAMGGAVVAAVGVVAVLYVVAHSSVNAAQQDLQSAQADNARLQAQLRSLSNVQAVYDEVAARQQLLTTAMGDEVRWSTYLNNLSLRIPENVWLKNISIQEGTGGAGATASATPAAPGSAPVIGTITFTGVGYTHDDVATWLESLAKEPAYQDPYFSNSTEAKIGAKPVVNFTSTVDVTAKAQSGRYSKPAGS